MNWQKHQQKVEIKVFHLLLTRFKEAQSEKKPFNGFI